MDPLAWLGLRARPSEYPRLQAIKAVVRSLLPHDEAVVIRYIVVVAALLARTAFADGRVLGSERARLRTLFEHIEQLPNEGIDALIVCLEKEASRLQANEMEACYGEIRALCNHEERIQVLQRLVEVAQADGRIHARESQMLHAVASELSIAPEEVHSLLEASQMAYASSNRPE